jgi:hypothetical protein
VDAAVKTSWVNLGIMRGREKRRFAWFGSQPQPFRQPELCSTHNATWLEYQNSNPRKRVTQFLRSIRRLKLTPDTGWRK